VKTALSAGLALLLALSTTGPAAVTPLPTNDTDHTFDLPDWQPRPVSEP
jgi:hypothetical protein